MSYDTEAIKWEELPADPNITLAVKNHAVLHHKGQLFLLGGSFGRTHRMDVLIYNIEKKSWTRVKHNDDMRPAQMLGRGRGVHMVGTPPSSRNGHTATLVLSKDEDGNERALIYIIGGWMGHHASSDLHILDITNPNKLKWVTAQATGISPGACNMHSADFIPQLREIFVFRGGDGSAYLNDLHALNVDTMKWRQINTTGKAPEPRADHASAYLSLTKELFIFGGWNGRERLNDLHVLNLETFEWSQPKTGGVSPQPRAGMTLTAVRDKLFVFGGNGTQSTVCNDVHVFDRSKMMFVQVVRDKSQMECDTCKDCEGFNNFSHSMDSIPCSMDCNSFSNMDNPNCIDSFVPRVLLYGTSPGRRAGHSATTVGRFIYIIGGSCGADYRSDCYVLDTDSLIFPQEAMEKSGSNMVSSQLSDLCNSETFSDVVFLVQGRQIYAHKLVLSLASEFFRAMFTNEFKEKADRAEIEIPHCSYDAFMIVLQSIYSGTANMDLNIPPSRICCEEDIEHLLEIMYISDQLLLDQLKIMCQQSLKGSINDNTVDYLLKASQNANAKLLESMCRHYLRNSIEC
jgi:hypothetical protein